LICALAVMLQVYTEKIKQAVQFMALLFLYVFQSQTDYVFKDADPCVESGYFYRSE
jgi:hypothetical protein